MYKILSTTFSVIRKEHRLNPKYFHFLMEKDLLVGKKKVAIGTLGDKKLFPLLSDGIHSAVTLEPQGSIRYLYVHSLKEGFIDVTDRLYLNEMDFLRNRTKELKSKAVLLSVVGTLGNTAMFSDYVSSPCTLPRNIAYVYCDDRRIYPEFLTCFFLSSFSRRQCAQSAGGNIQGLLSLSKLKKFVIPIPSTKEQEWYRDQYMRALALQREFLLAVETAKRRLYDALDIKIPQRVRSKSFSVPSSSLRQTSLWTPKFHNPLADSVMSKLSQKHEIVTLGEVCKIRKGNEVGSANYGNSLERKPSDLPFVRTSDIFNHEIDSYPDYWLDKSIHEDLNQDFAAGDVVLNNDGKIGFPAMITSSDKAVYQSHIKRIRSNDPKEFSNEYIFACLLTDLVGQIQFDKYTVVQSTIPTMANRIKIIKIPRVATNQHDVITKQVKTAYSYVEAKKEIIRKIRERIDSSIQAYCS